MKRVIQKDIADALGIHVSSVSKALKGDPAMADATVTQVRAKAAELGFVPDPMMGALAAYRQQSKPEAYRATLAWVHNHKRTEQMDVFPGYADYFEGASRRARELGYRLDPFWVEKEGERGATRLERILEARGIRGLVVAPQADPDQTLNLDWDRYASVAIGYTLKAPDMDRVTNDHFATMVDLLEILRRRGYQRIGCFLWEVDNQRMGHRARSAFQSVSRVAQTIVRTYEKFRATTFVTWVRRHRLDAVVCRGAEQLAALEEAGISFPDQLGITGYALDKNEARLSGMYHNNQHIGSAAIEWVSGKLQRGQFGRVPPPKRLLIASQWLENQSLKKMADKVSQSNIGLNP